MSTTIKLECWKGDKTTVEQWDRLLSYCKYTFDEWDEDDSFITIETLNCSYSSAYIESQFSKELRESLINSDITINMWYEEREPDESLTL